MIPLGSADSERFAELLEWEDDSKEAMAEVEIDGMTAGDAIRHQNDVIVDLLEALENLENDAGQIPSHAWQMVKSAIAKARGEK